MTPRKTVTRSNIGLVFTVLVADAVIVWFSSALAGQLTARLETEVWRPLVFGAVLGLVATLVRKIAMPRYPCLILPDHAEFDERNDAAGIRRNVFLGTILIQAVSLVAIFWGWIVVTVSLLKTAVPVS